MNPNYPYNEPIKSTAESGLHEDGHVKCDALFGTIKEDDIIMRVGRVTQLQYDRFVELYEMFMSGEKP